MTHAFAGMPDQGLAFLEEPGLAVGLWWGRLGRMGGFSKD